MPSKPVLTLANTYTITFEMANIADPSVTWRNSWDIHAGAIPVFSDPIIVALTAFQRRNLRTDAQIISVTIRNWSQGPQPFASRPFLSQTLIADPGTKNQASPLGYGGEAAGNQSVPGSTVLLFRKTNALGGRGNNGFLRGLLDGGDTASETGGKPVLIPTARVTPAAFGLIVFDLLPGFIGGAGPKLVLVHVGNHGAGPAFSSDIATVALVRASQNKQTRKNKR